MLSLEGQYERYNRKNSDTPPAYILETTELPITIKYFDPTGFAHLSPRFVWQRKLSGKLENKTDFAVVDMSIGYRLQNQRGIISLDIMNLANEKFLYQDTYDRTSDKFNVVTPFIPSRSFMFKTVLNF